jgi:hypothetical protein
MIDPAHVPPVDPQEMLARYVLYRRYVRSSDQTVRPEAFIPHPHVDLSVTRHRQASEAEIWHVGAQVARGQSKTLYGRADLPAQACTAEGLRVVEAPVAANPNHANITGWPSERPQQKMIAMVIAEKARYVSNPPQSQP